MRSLNLVTRFQRTERLDWQPQTPSDRAGVAFRPPTLDPVPGGAKPDTWFSGPILGSEEAPPKRLPETVPRRALGIL